MTLGWAAAFLGGVAALFSPCSAMLLPSFFAIAFGTRKATLLGRVAIFALGMLLTLVPMGMAAGTVGSVLVTHRQAIALIGGGLLVVIGLLTAAGISIPMPGLRTQGGTSALAVLALGAVYGLAGACTGPLLGAVLTFVAVSASWLYGALMLAVFAAGMVVPLAVLALCWDAGRMAERLRPREIAVGPLRTTLWGLVTGVLFVAMGVLFLVSDATGALGGIFDASQQMELESRLWSWSESIPDVAVLLVLAVTVGLLAWWAVTRRDPEQSDE